MGILETKGQVILEPILSFSINVYKTPAWHRWSNQLSPSRIVSNVCSQVSKRGHFFLIFLIPISWAMAMPVVVLGNFPFFDHASSLFDGAVSGLLLMASGVPYSFRTAFTSDNLTSRWDESNFASLKRSASNSWTAINGINLFSAFCPANNSTARVLVAWLMVVAICVDVAPYWLMVITLM